MRWEGLREVQRRPSTHPSSLPIALMLRRAFRPVSKHEGVSRDHRILRRVLRARQEGR